MKSKALVKRKETEELAIWEKMDVDPGQIARHPSITPILLQTLGKIENVIKVLKTSDNKDALTVVDIWENATARAKKVVPFEGFCLAAKTTPKAMIGIIMQTVVEQGNLASELLLAASQPAVVQKTIQLAKTKQGYEERKIVLQNRGVMAAPKNQVFFNSGTINQDNRKQIAVGQLMEDDDKIAGAVDSFNTHRAAQGNLPKPEVIDVTLEDSDG